MSKHQRVSFGNYAAK
jgi:small subunit ribosomal protein S19e